MTDELREIFFTESEDLVASMSDGLSAMSEGNADPETVNAVFRAVHSIKGAAGAFGLSDLVSFAHSFETALDALRSDRLAPEPEVLHLLQRAGDVLAALLDAAREDRPDAPESLAAVLDLLEELSGEGAAEEDFIFEPIGLALFADDSDAQPRAFEITFWPFPSLFANGHEPTNLFAALAELGDLSATCDTSALPPLAEVNPEDSYLGWTLRLVTDAPEDQVREVFAFVEGLCELEIGEAEGQVPDALTDPAPLADEPVAPVPTPAISPPDPGPQLTPPPPASSTRDAPRPTLRVDLDRVDRLINWVGELIISQAAIAQKIAEADVPRSAALDTHVEDLTHLARDIQEGVMSIRAQPLKPLFQRMARVVREAAEATGKQVDLVTEGEDTEVDRTVIEGLADPLMHMLRNAVDHGIESPDERLAKGKPAKGRLLLSASHVSGNVRIIIRDDGAGLDRPRIKATAIRKGLIPAEAVLSESDIDALLFLPGFSTAASVTNLSGRGVGMDVVRSSVVGLGGRVGIASRPGEGTSFTISLPLTLAVLDGLIVSAADQTLVVPVSSVLETIRPTPREFVRVGRGEQVLSVGATHVPILDIGAVLGLGPPLDPVDAVMVLVRTGEDSQAALAVAGIVDKRQVVIKSLRNSVGTLAGISAATILGDGKVALILDPDALVAIPSRRSPIPSLEPRDSDHECAA